MTMRPPLHGASRHKACPYESEVKGRDGGGAFDAYRVCRALILIDRVRVNGTLRTPPTAQMVRVPRHERLPSKSARLDCAAHGRRGSGYGPHIEVSLPTTPRMWRTTTVRTERPRSMAYLAPSSLR